MQDVNCIVIIHHGGELSKREQAELINKLSEYTACDSDKVQLTQLNYEDIVKAVVANVLYANGNVHVVRGNDDTQSHNPSPIEESIEIIASAEFTPGAKFPAASAFGRILAASVLSGLNSSGKKEVILRNALVVLASVNTDDFSFNSSQCKKYGFTKAHLLEIKKIHNFYSSYML